MNFHDRRHTPSNSVTGRACAARTRAPTGPVTPHATPTRCPPGASISSVAAQLAAIADTVGLASTADTMPARLQLP